MLVNNNLNHGMKTKSPPTVSTRFRYQMGHENPTQRLPRWHCRFQMRDALVASDFHPLDKIAYNPDAPVPLRPSKNNDEDDEVVEEVARVP